MFCQICNFVCLDFFKTVKSDTLYYFNWVILAAQTVFLSKGFVNTFLDTGQHYIRTMIICLMWSSYFYVLWQILMVYLGNIFLNTICFIEQRYMHIVKRLVLYLKKQQQQHLHVHVHTCCTSDGSKLIYLKQIHCHIKMHANSVSRSSREVST